MIPAFITKQEKREKKGFNASDYGKIAFDIYHAFKGTEPTNPPEWTNMLRFGAGKGVELAMVKVLQDSGIVSRDWNQDDEETYEMEREGVKVRMKIDAIVSKNDKGLEEGAPIEIKSINPMNRIDIARYAESNPRDNYVGQLAIYMDYLHTDIGYLFVASMDGLSYFWLTCRRVKDRIYECGNTTVDLDKEYKRWAQIQKDNVIPSKQPDPFEAGRYKIPLNAIDWTKISKGDIAKARAGTKVIGDEDAWKISYSPYKELIIKAQGSEVGYTDAEIAQINEATKGYTAKK